MIWLQITGLFDTKWLMLQTLKQVKESTLNTSNVGEQNISKTPGSKSGQKTGSRRTWHKRDLLEFSYWCKYYLERTGEGIQLEDYIRKGR